ncbi:hypothetical protein ACLOJK_014426 [Asimina triloba]
MSLRQEYGLRPHNKFGSLRNSKAKSHLLSATAEKPTELDPPHTYAPITAEPKQKKIIIMWEEADLYDVSSPVASFTWSQKKVVVRIPLRFNNLEYFDDFAMSKNATTGSVKIERGNPSSSFHTVIDDLFLITTTDPSVSTFTDQNADDAKADKTRNEKLFVISNRYKFYGDSSGNVDLRVFRRLGVTAATSDVLAQARAEAGNLYYLIFFSVD